MSRHDDLSLLLDHGLVAILRANSGEELVNVAKALYEGGIRILEVTFTVPNAAEVISAVDREMGKKILLGAGTVLDPETARQAFFAGAKFLVSPTVNFDVIKMGTRYDRLVMPGAYTPTEILSAWEAGADVIKLFPAEIGGPDYMKAVKRPLPQVRIMPTGGVNLDTMASFHEAGACAFGLGSSLVDRKALENKDFATITETAAAYVAKLKEIRAR